MGEGKVFVDRAYVDDLAGAFTPAVPAVAREALRGEEWRREIDRNHGVIILFRDIHEGLPPKDFDIATAARPNQVKKLFRTCRVIGRRFRLAHIHVNGKIIEVSTFRGMGPDPDASLRDVLLQAALQGLVAGLLGLWTFSVAITRLGAARAAAFGALAPVVSALGGYACLGDALTPIDGLAVACAVLGVALASGGVARPRPADPAAVRPPSPWPAPSSD